MTVEGLRECGACGHVQNHHGGHGCHVAGCLCRRFVFQMVSQDEHRAMIAEANRRLREAYDEITALQAENEALKSGSSGTER